MMKQGTVKCLFMTILGIVFFSVTNLSAAVNVSGTVYDKQNEPLENVLVMLHQASDSTVLCYQLTTADGRYELECLDDDIDVMISISRIGIQKQVKPIQAYSQEIDFVAERSVTKLEQVDIIAEKQWRTGDTLNFLIPAFINRNDVVIADVIRRIPGMRVTENGTIAYRGRAIRSLHVEGADVSNGRYGVMVNSIAAKDVCVVQVLDAYQPIKVLQKTHFTDDVALNFKMMKTAKQKQKLNASVGLGADFNKNILWKAELLGLYVGEKHQHLLSYKTNNSGVDVRIEQGTNAKYTPLTKLPFTQMIMPSTPDISSKHYFFNNTHTVSSQNYFKANENTELIYNLRYNYNEENRRSISSTSFTIPGEEDRVVKEEISTEMNRHKIEADLLYKYNTEKTFFNNYLNLNGIFDDGKGIIKTEGLLEQKYQSKTVELLNNTHFVKKKQNGENGIDLNLTQTFVSKPHQLSVGPGLYPEIFNEGQPYDGILQQQLRYNAFMSRNKLSFLNAFNLWGISLNPTMHFNLQGQYLSSHLEKSLQVNSPMTIIRDSVMNNESDWMRANAGLSMEAIYNTKKFYFNLKLPFSHNWYHLNNRYKNTSNSSMRWTFQPSLYMRLRFTRRWDLSTSASLSDFVPTLRNQYTGNILQNYRRLNRYEDNSKYYVKTANSTSRLSYRNARKQFFSNLSFAYEGQGSNGIYGQNFSGSFSSTHLEMVDNTSHTYQLLWDISKGIDWNRLIVSAQASVGKREKDQFRQGELLKSHFQWAQVNLTTNMTTSFGLSIRNSMNWYAEVAQEGDNKKHPPMHTFNNSLRVDFSMLKDVNIFSVGDYYFTRTKNGDKHFAIFDMGVEYSYGPIKYSLLWNNILNTKYYISSYYSNMNSYYSEYSIRPAAIMLNLQFNLF